MIFSFVGGTGGNREGSPVRLFESCVAKYQLFPIQLPFLRVLHMTLE